MRKALIALFYIWVCFNTLGVFVLAAELDLDIYSLLGWIGYILAVYLIASSSDNKLN